MALDLTKAIHSLGLRWKEESLKTLAWGDVLSTSFQLVTKTKSYNVPATDTLKAVGVTVGPTGNPMECQNERRGIATSALYATKDVWDNSYIGAATKIGYYFEQKLPVYLYGCEAWPISVSTLTAIDKWHKHALRTVVSHRWNPEKEDYHQFL